ncbi:MAG: hypothetical protein AAB227_01185 [Pseudomonadota bacterium]
MKRLGLAIAAIFLLAACDKKEAASAPVAAEIAEAPSIAVEEIVAVDPAAQIEGDASSAWVELMGVWAADGACGDYRQEWRLDGEAFHQNEMHCKIERLELLQNGVRAVAQCAIEGDDDQVVDVFKFVRRADATLSIINEANETATDGLLMCGEDAIP